MISRLARVDEPQGDVILEKSLLSVDSRKAELSQQLYEVYLAGWALEKTLQAHGVPVSPVISFGHFVMDAIAGRVVDFVALYAEQHRFGNDDKPVLSKPREISTHTSDIEAVQSMVMEGLFYYSYLRARALQSDGKKPPISIQVKELPVPDAMQSACATPQTFFAHECIRNRYNLGGHPAVLGSGGVATPVCVADGLLQQSDLTAGDKGALKQSEIISLDQTSAPLVDGETQACDALPAHAEELVQCGPGSAWLYREIERLTTTLEQANRESDRAVQAFNDEIVKLKDDVQREIGKRTQALKERDQALHAGQEEIKHLKKQLQQANTGRMKALKERDLARHAGREKIGHLKQELQQANSEHERVLKEWHQAIEESNNETRKLREQLKEVSQECSEARERGDQALRNLREATQQLQEQQTKMYERVADFQAAPEPHEERVILTGDQELISAILPENRAEIERLKRQIATLRHNDQARREQESVQTKQLAQREMRIRNLQEQLGEVKRENQLIRDRREADLKEISAHKAQVRELQKRCEALESCGLAWELARRTQLESEVVQLREQLAGAEEREAINRIRIEAQAHKIKAQEWFGQEMYQTIQVAAKDKRLAELLNPAHVVDLLRKLAQVKYDLERYTGQYNEQLGKEQKDYHAPLTMKHHETTGNRQREIA